MSHPQPTFRTAVLLANDFMTNGPNAHVTSIIDTRSLAIFREFEIAGFAERFALSTSAGNEMTP
jgi:hypothetical protein